MHIFRWWRFLRFRQLQRDFVDSGLAAINGVVHPKDLAGLALIPPFATHWDSFTLDEKKTLISNYVSVFIHNAINSEDFPSNSELTNLLVHLNKSIRSLSNNPWLMIIKQSAKTGIMIKKEDLLQLEAHDQLILAGARNEWESIVSAPVDKIIFWIHDNIEQIQAWHMKRLDYFK